MKNYSVNIKITPKKAVNDPRGTQVMNGLKNLGYDNLNQVSVGKYIVISINAKKPKPVSDNSLNTTDQGNRKITSTSNITKPKANK